MSVVVVVAMAAIINMIIIIIMRYHYYHNHRDRYCYANKAIMASLAMMLLMMWGSLMLNR